MRFSQSVSRPDVMPTAVSRGFTLIELMVTIAVLAILLGVAVPSFNGLALSTKLGSYANSFVASATMARSEAIKRNAVVTMCVSADGASCATTGGWEQGWMVACKTTSPSTICDGVGPNWIVFQRQQPAASGFKLTETSSPTQRSLSFMPTGVGATQATLKICRATPTIANQQREVTLSATGRASAKKITSTTCS